MTAIHAISMYVFVVMSAVAFIYWYMKWLHRSDALADTKFWYLAVYVAGAGASAWASAAALFFEKTWVYPLSVGLVIATLTTCTYVRNQSIDLMKK